MLDYVPKMRDHRCQGHSLLNAEVTSLNLACLDAIQLQAVIGYLHAVVS